MQRGFLAGRGCISRMRDASSCAGEINTLQGNLNWVASREHELSHPTWKGREEALLPLCNAAQSDSVRRSPTAQPSRCWESVQLA